MAPLRMDRMVGRNAALGTANGTRMRARPFRWLSIRRTGGSRRPPARPRDPRFVRPIRFALFAPIRPYSLKALYDFYLVGGAGASTTAFRVC
jgi:hypothetical protein